MNDDVLFFSAARPMGEELQPIADEVAAAGFNIANMTLAEEQALYYWLFPNVMLNFYPDNLQINIILPLGHGRTLTIFEWYFEQPGTGPGWESMQQSVAFSDQVQKEDIALCEAVQRGLQSQSYNQGRFSVKRENGAHHFHGLLDRYLRAEQ